MKIIKHGNYERLKEICVPLLFECDDCGCQYIANTDECKEETFFGRHMSYQCKCPDCGRMNVNDD